MPCTSSEASCLRALSSRSLSDRLGSHRKRSHPNWRRQAQRVEWLHRTLRKADGSMRKRAAASLRDEVRPDPRRNAEPGSKAMKRVEFLLGPRFSYTSERFYTSDP